MPNGERWLGRFAEWAAKPKSNIEKATSRPKAPDNVEATWFKSTGEFVAPLVREEIAGLDAALVERPRTTLQAMRDAVGKYRSIVEALRIVLPLMAGAGGTGRVSPAESANVQIDAAADEVYRMLLDEEGDAEQPPAAWVTKTDERYRPLMDAIRARGYDELTETRLNDILPYIVQERLDLDDAARLMQDESAYIEASIASYRYDGPAERSVRRSLLAGWVHADVKEMNLKKGLPDRFAAADRSTANRLYATIALEGDNMRPSTAGTTLHGETYVGVFDRLFAKMDKDRQAPGEFLERMGYMAYKSFFSVASEHGRIGEFLGRAATPLDRAALVAAFVGGLEANPNERDVSAVAQTIIGEQGTALGREIRDQVRVRYEQSLRDGDGNGVAAYGYLSAMYGDEAREWLGERYAEYAIDFKKSLPAADLFNDRGENVQAHYFYNDEDGRMSFIHFLEEYRDWNVSDHESWIEVSKQTKDGKLVRMFANRPEFSREGGHGEHAWWLAAGARDGQVEMHEYLIQNDLAPRIQVHRGHSYYSKYTAVMLSASTRLYVDGSCGGGNRIEAALEHAPNAQFVYNLDEGMASINDIVLRIVNERLEAGEDIVWSSVRAEARAKVEDGFGLGFGVIFDDFMEGTDTRLLGEERFAAYVFPDMPQAAGSIVGRMVESSVRAETE